MKKRIACFILCLALVIVIGGELVLSAFSIKASAETTSYSGVLEDLEKDENFNPEDYQVIPGDYSLHLITIAESVNGELFVYVYQPAASTRNLATSINISTLVRTKNEFKNYHLELIDYSNVFFKYKVLNFDISSNLERYYEISSIFRSWNASFGDKDPGAGNKISEVSFPVGRQFKYISDVDGNTSFTVDDVEYIRVTDKFVGYIRYKDQSISFNTTYTNFDAHFVAIDTDREMEELLEADIYFKQDKFTRTQKPNNSGTGYDVQQQWVDPEEKYVYINFLQKAYASYGNPFEKHEQVWDRIQKTENFLSQEYENGIFEFPGFKTLSTIEFTNESYAALKNTKWVISFVETENIVSITNLSGVVSTVNYRVGDVSVLRLKFRTNGDLYDLGVVDNKQTGSKDPSAIVKNEVSDLLKIIIMLFVLGITIMIFIWLSPFILLLLKVLWDLFIFIIEILLYLIFLPFKLIGRLFRKK